jgi:hypothetical protein
MLIKTIRGKAPLDPEEVRFDTNTLRVQAHLARSAREIEQAIEACVRGDEHAEGLLPLVKLRREEVASRAKARLAQPIGSMTAFRLNFLLVNIGVLDGARGLVRMLSSPDAGTRRSALALLPGASVLGGIPEAEIRSLIESCEEARRGLRTILFEADRWNRRLAILLCIRLGIEIHHSDCVRLLKEKPDPRGETSALLEYMLSRKIDLGAVDVLERLVAAYAPDGQYQYQSLFAAVVPFLRDATDPLHERVFDLLAKFVRTHLTPASARADELHRFNDMANAIRAIEVASSDRVIAIMREVLESETAMFPRSCAWQILCERLGFEALQNLLENEQSDRTVDAVLASIFADSNSMRELQLDWARQLIAAPWATRGHERAAVFLRRHGDEPADQEIENPDHIDFERMTASQACEHLVQRELLSEKDAANALHTTIQRKGTASRAHDILEHARLLTIFDVESPQSPPIYSSLLSAMAENCRGRFNPSDVSQLWYSEGEDETGSSGVVQFVFGGELVEFGVHDYGDYYDMRAVLKAVDAVLERANVLERFVPLGAGDQLMILAFCRPEQAETMAKITGLKLMQDPNGSMHAGRGFEACVRGRQ